LILCDCQSVKQPRTSHELELKDSQNVEFQRIKDKSNFRVKTTSCITECPAFEFFYLSDSIAIISSKENLLPAGDYYHLLNQDEIKELEELINSVSWEKYNELYPTLMKDLPTIEYTVNLKNGIVKRIKINGLEPQQLIKLRGQLIEIIQTYQWTKIG